MFSDDIESYLNKADKEAQIKMEKKILQYTITIKDNKKLLFSMIVLSFIIPYDGCSYYI